MYESPENQDDTIDRKSFDNLTIKIDFETESLFTKEFNNKDANGLHSKSMVTTLGMF